VVVVLLYMHNSSTDVVTVVVTLQYMHSTLTYVATMAVVLLYCTLLACSDVATVVAGTASVTVVNGTCHKTFRCFALGL